MSGHSKWATTKRQKAVTDAKRSNLFTKLSNVVAVAARAGGDPTTNFQLRLAIDKARAANMPKDGIEKAIKRGTGELGGAQIDEALYEAYGPSGTAILIQVTTDNKNRAVGEIKAILNKLGGKLANAGSVAYLFERKGEIGVSARRLALGGQLDLVEKVEGMIIESGADDYQVIDGEYLVYCRVEDLSKVRQCLEEGGLEVESAEIVYLPKSQIALDEEKSSKVINLLEALDELDDVTSVNSNLA